VDNTTATDVEAGRFGEVDFEADAARVLQRLRSALAEVVSSLPGHVSRPAELRRALKIDMNLSSKVFKVVNASGSMAAGPHVPGLSALRTFLTAARKAGVDERRIEQATETAVDFDRLVTSHAGDRPAFDSMVSSLAGAEDGAQVTLQHRRLAFRGQRHIFGAHARVQFKCVIAQPGTGPAGVDYAQVKGVLALRRLRSDAPLIVSRVCATDDEGKVCEVVREPIDPQADHPHGLALLRDFCSQPLPQHQTVQIAPGNLHSQLLGSGVGNKKALDYVEGHVVRAALPAYRDEVHRVVGNVAQIRIPCEVLLVDLLVREDTYKHVDPVVYACSDHMGELPSPGESAPWQRLELSETVAHLGKGPGVLYDAEFPRYSELGRYVFDRLGWDGDRFDVYRCRVEYPVLPSSVVMEFELPEQPTS
jgi:hypothetical protein